MIEKQFKALALGVRFRHIGYPQNEKVWVKIGHNRIAEWESRHALANWVGQQICAFGDSDRDLFATVHVEI